MKELTNNCLVCKTELKHRQRRYCSNGCFHKGNVGSNNPAYKGAKLNANCMICGKYFEFWRGSKSGKYCSQPCAYVSPEWRNKQRAAKLGKQMPEAMRDAVSARFKGVPKPRSQVEKIIATQRAKRSSRVTKTDIMRSIRGSKAYQEWRRVVFERDHYTCVECGDAKGGNLEADHIIGLAFLVEEIRLTGAGDYYDADNGRTLCTECHKRTYSYARHWKNNLEGKLMVAIQQTGQDYECTMEAIINQLKEKLE